MVYKSKKIGIIAANRTRSLKNKNKNKNKKKRLRTRKPIKRKPITRKPIMYGHVYSTECGHCISMQGDWDKLKAIVGKDIELMDISDDHQGKVDALNANYQTDLKFNGFPTIFKFLRKSAPIEYYQGDRTTDNMKAWLYH